MDSADTGDESQPDQQGVSSARIDMASASLHGRSHSPQRKGTTYHSIQAQTVNSGNFTARTMNFSEFPCEASINPLTTLFQTHRHPRLLFVEPSPTLPLHQLDTLSHVITNKRLSRTS